MKKLIYVDAVNQEHIAQVNKPTVVPERGDIIKFNNTTYKVYHRVIEYKDFDTTIMYAHLDVL